MAAKPRAGGGAKGLRGRATNKKTFFLRLNLHLIWHLDNLNIVNRLMTFERILVVHLLTIRIN